MPFLYCTEERGGIVFVPETATQYVNISLSSILAARLGLMTFYKPFKSLRVGSHFKDWVKETVFGLRLMFCGHSCWFSSRHFADFHAAPTLVRLRLLVLVNNWWRYKECSWPILATISIVTACFLVHVISWQASELIFRIAVSKFCNPSFIYFFSSAPVGRPVGFGSSTTGIADITAQKVRICST